MIKFTQHDVFIVTGGSSGIGAESALKINELGGTVIAIARDDKRLVQIRNRSTHPDNFYIKSFDLGKDAENIPPMIASFAQQHGKIKGLVHSAGIDMLTPLKSVDKKNIQSLYDTNVLSSIFLMKALSKKNIHADNCSAVFLSSISSIIGYPGYTVYASSKGAINSMIKPMAVELAHKKIRVNCILCGHVNTPMTQKNQHKYGESYKQELQNRYPLGIGTANDVANVATFFLADASAWITGQTIIADGGRTIS